MRRLPAGVSTRSVTVAALAALALGVFGKIAEDVFHRESTDFDRSASLLVHRLDSPVADFLMRLFSAAGSFPTVILVVVAVIAWSLHQHARAAAYVLCAVTATCEGLNTVLKLSFERARPTLIREIITLHSYSFPSGHAMAVVAIYGTVAFILARQWPRAGRWISCIALALILLVGLSRVFLGAHWVTDVLAGYAAGAFIMLAGILTLNLLADTPRAGRRP